MVAGAGMGAMKKNTLLWIAGTGIGVMAVIAGLTAAQPRAVADAGATAVALMSGPVGGPETSRNLWCGLAFRIVTEEAPSENQDKAVVRQYAEGGRTLLAAAEDAYRAGGYSAEAFAAHLELRAAEIAAEVNAADKPTEFSFEECSALIGL
jgi:hypothetical protein